MRMCDDQPTSVSPNFISPANCGALEKVLQPYTNPDPNYPTILSRGEGITYGRIICRKRRPPSGPITEVLSTLVIFAEQSRWAKAWPLNLIIKPHAVLACMAGEENCIFWKELNKRRLEQANRLIDTN